jgi:hypothetical protein
LGSAFIIKAQSRNATGTVEFKVRWNYLMMGKSQYRPYLYGVDQNVAATSPLIKYMDSAGWEQAANAVIAECSILFF